MDERLVALDLFLKALGIPSAIKTVRERKLVQKAVYLGQRAGVDLGYGYGWYLMGPYSTSLTRDYYALADELDSAGKHGQSELHDQVKQRLAGVKPLLEPATEALSQSDWVELVASYDYLRKVSGYDHNRAVETLKKAKPHLVGNVDMAVEALKRHGLVKN